MVMAAVVGGVAVGALASGGGPDIPDPDPSVGRAQETMANLAVRQQDYYENTVSPLLMEQVRQQTATAGRVADSQVSLMDEQRGQSRRMNERYWGTQVPLEDELIGKARSYNEAGEQERMAGQAAADVEQATAIGQRNVAQSLRARGVNLGSPAAVAAMTEMQTQSTMAKVGAMNKTRETARQMGWQRLGEVTALGKGLPQFGQGSAGLAINAGNSAVAAGAAGVGAAGTLGSSSLAQLGGQVGAQGAIAGIGMQLSNYGAAQAQYANANDPMNQIIGAAAGYGMSYLGSYAGAAGTAAGRSSDGSGTVAGGSGIKF